MSVVVCLDRWNVCSQYYAKAIMEFADNDSVFVAREQQKCSLCILAFQVRKGDRGYHYEAGHENAVS